MSPLPCTSLTPPFKKKGTSLPISKAILYKLSDDISRFIRLVNANNVHAALLLPPPNPAPTGMFLFKWML